MALIIDLADDAEQAKLCARGCRTQPMSAAEVKALSFEVDERRAAHSGLAMDPETGEPWIKFWVDVDAVDLVRPDDDELRRHEEFTRKTLMLLDVLEDTKVGGMVVQGLTRELRKLIKK